MRQFTDAEILQKAMTYSLRQVEIICADPDDIKYYPTKGELQKLVDKTDELYDFDTYSILNEKYDLSVLNDNRVEEMEIVSPERRQKAEEDFLSLMKKINPQFVMPEFKKDGKKDV